MKQHNYKWLTTRHHSYHHSSHTIPLSNWRNGHTQSWLVQNYFFLIGQKLHATCKSWLVQNDFFFIGQKLHATELRVWSRFQKSWAIIMSPCIWFDCRTFRICMGVRESAQKILLSYCDYCDVIDLSLRTTNTIRLAYSIGSK